MSTRLGRLNASGLEAFTKYLADVRSGTSDTAPLKLLVDDRTSDELPWTIRLAAQDFSTRYELGKYLVKKLSQCDQRKISHDLGLWSWLGLFYFDQLCPVISNKRSLRENYTYILSRDYRHQPRHSIRTTYIFVRDYGYRARFMFSKPLNERGEIIEQLMARQELASCSGVVKAAYALYDDANRLTFKRGAAGRGKGCVARYITILQQFSCTYDLWSLSAKDIVAMLPPEFNRFRDSG